MYNLLADETAASLRAFFQNTLPFLAEKWWPRHVVNALPFQQQRRVEESRIESLAGLDLAAFLLSKARYYAKEIQAIRGFLLCGV